MLDSQDMPFNAFQPKANLFFQTRTAQINPDRREVGCQPGGYFRYHVTFRGKPTTCTTTELQFVLLADEMHLPTSSFFASGDLVPDLICRHKLGALIWDPVKHQPYTITGFGRTNVVLEFVFKTGEKLEFLRPIEEVNRMSKV